MKTIKEKIRLIDSAYSALEFLNNQDWTNHRETLFAMCLEEEKRHRSAGFGRHHPNAVSATEAAKLFSVKRVAQYLARECRMPRGKDFLHYQRSCFYAAGLVDKYRKEIRKAWRKLPVKALAALDYCEFVKAT